MGFESPSEIRKYSMGWILMVFFCIGSECVQMVTEPYTTLAECDINRHVVIQQILATEGITFFQIRCDEHHAPQI